MTEAKTPGRRIIFLVFAGMGLSAALVPASLPLVADELGVAVPDVLGAVPALFGGLLTGVMGAPLLVRSRPVTWVLCAGVLAQGTGLACFALAPSAPLVVVAAGLVGLGFGATEVTASASARALARTATTALLGRLMLVVALTAASAPLAVLAAGHAGAGRLALLAATGYHLACAWRLIHDASFRGSATPVPTPHRSALRRLPAGVVVALFLYVGVESILAGWSAVTVETTLGLDPSTAAIGTSAFWVLISIGRLASPWVQRHLRPARAVQVCAAVQTVTLGAAIVAGPSGVTVAVVLALAVVACGPCYAILLGHALTVVSDRAAPSATAVLIGVGAAGGALIPLAATLAARASGTRDAGAEGSAAAWIALGAAALLLVALARTREHAGPPEPSEPVLSPRPDPTTVSPTTTRHP
ncbi:hypothetical protein G1H11_15960 [Phytoactinopolyspora alkaliphila]|uniref:MFS transporter n=1 Tax=Phytoactinopolyspora alkaliphila TaxID=1783498 RepID=A0A6N9YPD3_9ACTN|nr:MFS transporter [Phytoactinopolyspora alkaliphila]NED96805.1 hypothetical protein [Phytoactinopolyspora alkaliphila]